MGCHWTQGDTGAQDLRGAWRPSQRSCIRLFPRGWHRARAGRLPGSAQDPGAPFAIISRTSGPQRSHVIKLLNGAPKPRVGPGSSRSSPSSALIRRWQTGGTAVTVGQREGGGHDSTLVHGTGPAEVQVATLLLLSFFFFFRFCSLSRVSQGSSA